MLQIRFFETLITIQNMQGIDNHLEENKQPSRKVGILDSSRKTCLLNKSECIKAARENVTFIKS